MTALWLLALVGLLGSVLLFVAGCFRLALFSRRPFPVSATALERKLVLGALALAASGSAGLFVLPAYQGSSCSVSVTAAVPPASASASNFVTVPMSSGCTEHSSTFYQANGPQVIPLFTIPILFAVVPLAFLNRRMRSLGYAVCAFLLAGQAAVGMSGYGLAFSPCSVLLAVAGFIGLFSRRAQQGTPADPHASASLRRGVG